MGSKDIHGITMAIIAALFRTHARGGLTVMTDVYCDLSDEAGPSLRAPDVALVNNLSKPRNEAYRGTPVLAVEVRGTQSKRYLEEKVKLYLEHEWPVVWIAHAEKHEVEVLYRGKASVTYRSGAEVPLLPELDKYSLSAVPVAAFFDDIEASRYSDGWAEAHGEARGEVRGQARALLKVLEARGFEVPERVRGKIFTCSDVTTLDRWIMAAAAAASAEAFVSALR